MSEHIYEDSNMEHERYHVIPFGSMREEIVRCRDCECASFDEYGGGWCNENCREIKPWDYCAWAKRGEK